MKSFSATLIAAIFCLGLTACLADEFDDFSHQYQSMHYPQYSSGYVSGVSSGIGMSHGYHGYEKGHGYGNGYGKGHGYGNGYGKGYVEETIVRTPVMPMPMGLPPTGVAQAGSGLFDGENTQIGILLFVVFILPLLFNGSNGLLG
ncbi:uncharacterized protein [Argopecten irradians]|uniref:uncharacterized protein n=1 Tax=Argopecten irradians TaxID=31199 RepID=UPI003720E86D